MKTCAGCGTRPVRKRRHARYCTPCIQKLPKKTCSVCQHEFQADMVVGRRCRPCISELAHAKRVGQLYGMTQAEYIELLEFQGGLCYICQRRPVSKRLAVDHDHETGYVRGLLCKACNRDVLGHFHDSVELLERAILYLNHPPAFQLWDGDPPRQP